MNAEKEAKILREAKERLSRAMQEDLENRRLAKEDLEFIAIEGKQWPDAIRAERIAEGRPCLSINKMPVFIDQVVGDQRMNRPAIKVVPVDSKSDPRTAQILSGWIKHVQQISKSDVAVDHAFEHAVACGYGALRVVTRYTSDSSFEQEAYIEKIDNALAVFWGKHSQYDASDAMYCFVVSDMDREEFKTQFGFEAPSFKSGADQFADGWYSKNTVRVAEYFVKEPVEKKIYLLEDGRSVDKLMEGDVPVRERKVKSYKIMWYLLSGDKVLDAKEWLGKKYIPVVPVWGKEFNVAGKRVVRGLIRNAKDSQRMFNYWNSLDTELIALQPKSPYILTPKQIAGYEDQWNEAHRRNYPYLLANPDKDAPGWPHREAPPQISSAVIQRLAETDQEIRDTIGLQKASLGMQSNERSGAAIRERKLEGDVGVFAFIDNLSRSLEHVGRILVDIAPALLDTERIIRIGLEDGTFDFVGVNMADAEMGTVLNDLSLGTYDVVVTTGPSFTTQRTEARESMKEFIQYYPAAAPYIGDIYAKVMDWAGADQLAKRLEYMLPPNIREALERERLEKEGKPVPPPQAEQLSPEQQVQIMELQARVEEARLRLEQEKVKLETLKVKNELMRNASVDKLKSMLRDAESEIGEEDLRLGEELKGEGEELNSYAPQPSVSSPTEPSVVNVGTGETKI